MLLILSKMKQKISLLIYYINIKRQILFAKKKVFLIGTPWYGNLGDQAITIGEKYILNKNFPNYTIIDIPHEVYCSIIVRKIGFKIKKDDVIFLQGGGNLGSLYPWEEELRRIVIKKFPDNKIIIMPVSIFFHNNNVGKRELKKSIDVYNKHKNLNIISRDEASYKFAVENFINAKNFLSPDAVTSLCDIINDFSVKRHGIIFLLRHGKEKTINNDIIITLNKYLERNNISYSMADTVVPYAIKSNKREKEIISVLTMIKGAKLIITDRYHGLIFSVITNTPVIVFKSFDTKISSGIKWFDDLHDVHYISDNNIEKILRLIKYYQQTNDINVKETVKYKNKIISTIKDIGLK